VPPSHSAITHSRGGIVNKHSSNTESTSKVYYVTASNQTQGTNALISVFSMTTRPDPLYLRKLGLTVGLELPRSPIDRGRTVSVPLELLNLQYWSRIPKISRDLSLSFLQKMGWTM
jgi:hypothetical protein